MTLAELLAELEARDIRIEVAGGRLRVEAPPGAMPAWLQSAMLEHKAALLARENGAPAVEDQPAPLAPLSPETSVPNETLDTLILPGGSIRISLDDLIYGDFLARHKLRIVDGTAYPDGRTFRPTIYLADAVAEEGSAPISRCVAPPPGEPGGRAQAGDSPEVSHP